MSNNFEAAPVRVILRVRPPLPSELSSAPFLQAGANASRITLAYPVSAYDLSAREYEFDAVYGPQYTQTTFYVNEIAPSVRAVAAGASACVVITGASGSGRRFTAVGVPGDHERRGAICAAIEELWAVCARNTDQILTISVLGVKNDVVYDLLGDPSTLTTPVRIQDAPLSPSRPLSVAMPGDTEVTIEDPSHLPAVMMAAGESAQRLGPANCVSIVYNITYYRRGGLPSRLSMVVLPPWASVSAGLAPLGSLGWQWSSLSSVLRDVSRAARDCRGRIQWRNSKLTLLIKDSLQRDGSLCTVVGTVASTPLSSFDATSSLIKSLFRLRQEVLPPNVRAISQTRVLPSQMMHESYAPAAAPAPAPANHTLMQDTSFTTRDLGTTRGWASSYASMPPAPAPAPTVGCPAGRLGRPVAGLTSGGLPTSAAPSGPAPGHDVAKLTAAELADVRADLAVRADVIRQLEADLGDAQEELRTLRARSGQAADAQAELGALRRSVLASDSDAARAVAEAAQARGERDDAVARAAGLEERALRAEDELSTLQRRVTAAETAAVNAEETASTLRQEVGRAQQRARDAEERAEGVRSRLADAQQDAVEAQRIAAHATAVAEGLRGELSDARSELAEMQEKLNAAERARESLEEQLALQAHETELLRDQLVATAGTAEIARDRVAAVEQRAAGNDERVQKLREELRAAWESARVAVREADRLRADNAVLRSRADANDERCTELRQRALTAEQEADRTERAHATATDLAEAAAAERERVAAELAAESQRRAEAENRARMAEGELDAIRKSHRRAVRDYESATSRVNDLQSQLGQARSAEREARTRADTTAEERRQLDWASHELAEQLEDATRQLGEAAAARRALQRQLDSAQQRASTLEDVTTEHRRTAAGLLHNREAVLARVADLEASARAEGARWQQLRGEAAADVDDVVSGYTGHYGQTFDTSQLAGEASSLPAPVPTPAPAPAPAPAPKYESDSILGHDRLVASTYAQPPLPESEYAEPTRPAYRAFGAAGRNPYRVNN